MKNVLAGVTLLAVLSHPFQAAAAKMTIDGDRRISDVRRRVAVEVALLHVAIFQGDCPLGHQLCDAAGKTSLKLALDCQRVHRQAAMERDRSALRRSAIARSYR